MIRFYAILITSILSYLSPYHTYTLTISPNKNNWNDTYIKGCTYKLYPNNKITITLKENEYLFDKYTDLLIHFNKQTNNNIKPYIGNYSIINKNLSLSHKHKVFGTSSAKFSYKTKIILTPKQGSIFNNTQSLGNFTIEFWAKPALLSNGETIFKRYGPVIKNGKVLKYSGIICSVKNKKINWQFHNIFHYPNFQNKNITIPLISINGKNTIIKIAKWMHHAITFNNITGKLTYYINGKEETSSFITKSKQAQDTILTPKFHKQEKLPLIIGENFYGYIDEFSISKIDKMPRQKIITQIHNSKQHFFNITPYPNKKGYITSVVYDLKNKNSKLEKVNINTNEKHNSYITFQYRISKNFFTPSQNNIPWQNINPHENTKPQKKGQYFQWKAILNNGYNGLYTPSLNNISFSFKQDQKPKTPIYLIAKSNNGKVILNWPANIEKDIIGYKIYYGIETGNYLASEKPIEINNPNINKNNLTINYTISNLEINKMYYFAVSAIDKNYNESNISPEASTVVRK